MRAKFGRGPTFESKKGSLKFISRYSTETNVYFYLTLAVMAVNMLSEFFLDGCVLA